MSVSPVTISRVSQNMQSNVLLQGMRRTMVKLLETQQQVSTGQRILRPSDDPIDATGALRLEDLLESQQQYLSNIDHASKVMNLADSTVGSIYDLAQSAHDLVLENAGTTVSSDQRESAATLVDSIIGQLVTLGNTEYLGRYLFAGTMSASAPFSKDDGQVRYAGNEGAQTIQVADDISEQVNLTAGQVFGTGTGVIASARELTPAATATTRLSDLNGELGQGIRDGTLVINGSVIGQVRVDIREAATLGDVIERINAALPPSVRAGLASGGQYLELVSTNTGETLQVLESGQGTIAHDLGLYTTTGAAGAISGSDLGARLVEQTPVSALNAGAGIDLTSGITISNGEKSITLDFSSAQTVQDVLNTINASGLGLAGRINAEGTGIEIVNTVAGSTVRIGENGGTTAADLGIATFSTNTPLAQLNGGQGVADVDGADFRIVTADGSMIDVDVSGAVTVADVVDRINTAGGGKLTAVVSDTGDGIVLTDGTSGAETFRVERLNLSGAAADLGILKRAESGATQIVGDHVGGTKEESVFTYLTDLREALLADDTQDIQRAGQKLEEYMTQLNRYRGKLGYMAKALDTRKDRTEDAVLSTQSLLSNLKDVDVTEAITRFQQLQTTLQANLQSGGQILNTSLLDYLE